MTDKARLVALVLASWRFVRADEPPGCRLEDVDVRGIGPVEAEVLDTLTMGPDGGAWLFPWFCRAKGFPELVSPPMTIAEVARMIRDISRPGTPYRSVQRAVRTLARRGLLRRVRGPHVCYVLPVWASMPVPGSVDVLRRRKSGFPSRVDWLVDYAARKGRDHRGRFVAD